MKQYVVDTFTDTIFKGNPATVCNLEDLNKDELVAYQASQRGGFQRAKMKGNRVKLSGKAVLFSKADINIY